MQDVKPKGSSKPSAEYNSAMKRDLKFDPNVKDGVGDRGLRRQEQIGPNHQKSPFEAYSVGCGITFTFGGLKIDTLPGMCSTSRTHRFPETMRQARRSAVYITSIIPARTDGSALYLGVSPGEARRDTRMLE